MTIQQVLIATISTIVLICIVFTQIGWQRVIHCFGLWFKRDYWVNYNTVELAAYTAKLLIIIPGLIFGIQIWQLYFLSLATSMALMWASQKKLLPSLVYFNTVWVWISCMVLAQHLF